MSLADDSEATWWLHYISCASCNHLNCKKNVLQPTLRKKQLQIQKMQDIFLQWTLYLKALVYVYTRCMYLIEVGGSRWKICRDTALFLLFANPIRCAVGLIRSEMRSSGRRRPLGRARTRREVSKTGFFWSQSEGKSVCWLGGILMKSLLYWGCRAGSSSPAVL